MLARWKVTAKSESTYAQDVGLMEYCIKMGVAIRLTQESLSLFALFNDSFESFREKAWSIV